MPTLYAIALGSNQPHARHGAPREVLSAALTALDEAPLQLRAASPLVTSRPIGPSIRRYANGAAIIETDLAPRDLLDHLKRRLDLGYRVFAALQEVSKKLSRLGVSVANAQEVSGTLCVGCDIVQFTVDRDDSLEVVSRPKWLLELVGGLSVEKLKTLNARPGVTTLLFCVGEELHSKLGITPASEVCGLGLVQENLSPVIPETGLQSIDDTIHWLGHINSF